MTPLSAFSSRIAPRVLTALDMTIEQAVLDTCIDFCEKSLIVKTTSDPLMTVQGVTDYEIDAPTGQLVCKVMRAWCGIEELAPLIEDDVSTPFGFTSAVTGETIGQNKPKTFHTTDPGVIALLPIPDAPYQITTRVACKPSRSATTVEDVLYENWVDEIVHGALSRLYAMTGQPFANEKLSLMHMGMYSAGVNRALVEATRGRNRAEQRIKPVRI